MSISVAQFRKELALQWAGELKENKLLQLFFEAVENDHPANHALNGDVNQDVSPTRASIELGVTRGYSMCLGKKLLCAIPLESPDGAPPESEYLPPEEEPEPQPKRKRKK